MYEVNLAVGGHEIRVRVLGRQFNLPKINFCVKLVKLEYCMHLFFDLIVNIANADIKHMLVYWRTTSFIRVVLMPDSFNRWDLTMK